VGARNLAAHRRILPNVTAQLLFAPMKNQAVKKMGVLQNGEVRNDRCLFL
jgi:hypothetical protein